MQGVQRKVPTYIFFKTSFFLIFVRRNLAEQAKQMYSHEQEKLQDIQERKQLKEQLA